MHSIRVKIFSFITLLLLVLLILLNIYPLTVSRDLVFEEKRSAMTGQASVLASSLSTLDRLTEESISEVMNLLDTGSFTRLVIVDPEGTVVYDAGTRVSGGSADEDLKTALSGSMVFRSDFADAAFLSSCAIPVYNQGKTLGAVSISELDTERAEIIISIQSRIRNISFAVAAAAFVAAFIMASLLLRRIRELVNSMRIVAGGNYSHRLATRGRDEISELGSEFNQLTERLDDTERQRRQFVADASHELKTPLASIMLLSDSIVQNDMDADTMREFVADIGGEAERLRRTTEKLLDLSRLDDGVTVEPVPVDIKQVTVDALVLLQPLADEKNVRLRCDLADGAVVMATVDDMFHIVFNLMENAVKYNVPGGTVVTKLRVEEDSVSLIVEDTGIGIPEEDRLNIFSRFYRVDKARSREAGGSGLGLSIVHDAVLSHGGTIAVGQNKPQGSRFVVTFPRPTSEETGI